MTSISQSFTYKIATKINWRRYETIITSLSPYLYVLTWHRHTAYTDTGRKCADTIGTVPVPRAGHFQC